jgi:hypothetical protein
LSDIFQELAAYREQLDLPVAGSETVCLSQNIDRQPPITPDPSVDSRLKGVFFIMGKIITYYLPL